MPAMSTVKLVGARIRQAREAMPRENGKPVSQTDFGHKVGVHTVTVSCWERGKYPPTIDRLMKIADVTARPIEFFTAPPVQGEQAEESDEEAASVLVMSIDDLLRRRIKAVQRGEIEDAVRAVFREAMKA